MNAEFSHRSLHGHPRARRRLFIATTLILVILAVDFLTHGVVRGYVRSAAASLWVFTGSARSSITGTGYFSTRRSLAAENAALRAPLSVRHHTVRSLSAREWTTFLPEPSCLPWVDLW